MWTYAGHPDVHGRVNFGVPQHDCLPRLSMVFHRCCLRDWICFCKSTVLQRFQHDYSAELKAVGSTSHQVTWRRSPWRASPAPRTEDGVILIGCPSCPAEGIADAHPLCLLAIPGLDMRSCIQDTLTHDLRVKSNPGRAPALTIP